MRAQCCITLGTWTKMAALLPTVRLRLKPALLCSMLMRALESLVFASFRCSVNSSLGSPFFLRLRLEGMLMSALPTDLLGKKSNK